MTKDNRRVLFSIMSLFIPLLGIVLFFLYTPRKDARLFGILGILSIVLWGWGGLNI